MLGRPAMRSASSFGMWMIAGTLLAVPARGVPAADLAALCASAKLRAAAHRLSDDARCASAAIRAGKPVKPECLARADTRLEAAFARAEATGGCVTVGDAAATEAIVDDALAALLAALPHTTTTSTSTTTTSTLPSAACGNGVREPGEQCDGGAFCNADCTLVSLAPGCCASTPTCRDASGFSLDFNIHNFCLPDPNVDGGVCGASGTCDILSIQPVPLCCEADDGTCTTAYLPGFTSAATTADLWWFFNHCEGITNRASHTVAGASCDATAHCQPS